MIKRPTTLGLAFVEALSHANSVKYSNIIKKLDHPGYGMTQEKEVNVRLSRLTATKMQNAGYPIQGK